LIFNGPMATGVKSGQSRTLGTIGNSHFSKDTLLMDIQLRIQTLGGRESEVCLNWILARSEICDGDFGRAKTNAYVVSKG